MRTTYRAVSDSIRSACTTSGVTAWAGESLGEESLERREFTDKESGGDIKSEGGE